MKYWNKRFNTGGVNPMIRVPQNWKKDGSVCLVDFGGRSNVYRLESLERPAGIRYKINLQNGKPFTFSIQAYSPVENETQGLGLLIGEQYNANPSNGMWKTLETEVENGTEIAIHSVDNNGEYAKGDVVYVDVSSVQVK